MGPLLELAGLAGAGKTTLARLLGASVSGVDPTRGVGRVRMASGLLPALPSLALARAGSRGRGWTSDEWRSLAYLGAWQGAVRRRTDPRPAVLDHGPVYRLASLSAFGPPLTHTAALQRHWHRRVGEWVELLDLVVWLDAPDELLLDRIDERQREHRIRHSDPTEARAFLARWRAAYGQVLATFEEAGTPVLRLDSGMHTPGELAQRVCARLAAGSVPR